MELAQQRWSVNHFCDLHPETWTQLFDRYRIGEILEAIKRCGKMDDWRPERHYQRLVEMLERVAPHQ